MNELDELRGLVTARTLLDREIERSAVRAVASDISRTAIANALGVSRAHLYRTVVKAMKANERAEL